MVGNPSVYVLHSWNAYRVGCFFVCEARRHVRIVPYKTEKVTIKVQNAIHDGSTLQSKKVTPKVQNTILAAAILPDKTEKVTIKTQNTFPAILFLPETSEKLTLKVQNVHTRAGSTLNSKNLTLKVQKYYVSGQSHACDQQNCEKRPYKISAVLVRSTL